MSEIVWLRQLRIAVHIREVEDNSRRVTLARFSITRAASMEPSPTS
jgi:hypothetical protein